MNNVIHVDFARRRRRKQLTLQAGRATVRGALPKEQSRSIADSIKRMEHMLEVLREGRTKQDRD